jgi:hypothetical protein
MSRGGQEVAMTEDYFAPLRGATYVQLTTFRRSGAAVPTAMHIVLDGDEAFFRTTQQHQLEPPSAGPASGPG